MTKSTLLAIFGGFVVAIAITLNFYFDEVEEKKFDVQKGSPPIKTPPSASSKIPPYKADLPKKGVTLNAEASPQRKVNKPSFDVVRVNPDGDTVIAGRAAPEAKVEIFDGEKQIGEVLADKRGEWVFLPSSPLPPGNRKLSLMMTDENDEKIDSENALVLLVPEKGKDIAGRPSQASTQPLALKVPIGDEGSIEVLQKATPVTNGEFATKFAVDAIDYNERGKLNIVGKAPKKALIQLYLNEKFMGRTSADDIGIWGLSPAGSIKAGIYTLRADHIQIDGKVLARREVVFARSVPLTGVKPGSLVVVESGNSLWRIARRTYGSGFRYTVIYDANKEQIKNADLIFPGQVFALPSTR
ncbi:LysM peptidoglycan-binding domain-containing protein [Rhodospirillales bacterium]|nr:LysM peptidoglycan-binding domain-containing protein [Rhodospirillales bacterium]